MAALRTILDHPGKPRVSMILIDWGVRESFHCLDYLNRQTAPRDSFELVWIEYYDHVPEGLERKARDPAVGARVLDQWHVMGRPADEPVHKHLCYNVGMALARGDICIVCDSDAVYPEDFIDKIIEAFAASDKLVVHVDQVRNENRSHYPFDYPNLRELLSEKETVNWTGKTTTGLVGQDRLHECNYGACMAARRDAIMAIGGADEHDDYVGYICGPYDMTFRLTNAGYSEQWLPDLFTIHTWHPSAGGGGNIGGPHDGRGVSLRALEARDTGRTTPWVEDPAIRLLREDSRAPRERVLDILRAHVEVAGRKAADLQHKIIAPPELVRANVRRHNVILFEGKYYALPHADGPFIPTLARSGDYERRLVTGTDLEDVVRRVRARATAETIRALPSRILNRIARAVGLPYVVRAPRDGVRLYFHRGMYYALPEGEAMSAARSRSGEYAQTVLCGANLEELEQRLGWRPASRSKRPLLIYPRFARHNIVLYDGVYYAVPLRMGEFHPHEADAGKYSALVHGGDPRDVLHEVSTRARRKLTAH